MSDLERPESPSVVNKDGSTSYRPEELNADLAAAKMANDVVNKLPKPAIVSKKFAVYQGMWSALNHNEQNNTGFDCSMRLSVYSHVADTSVNIDGALFKNLWAYLMKPKFIIQGMPMNADFENKEPGFFGKLLNRVRGKSTEASNA